MAITSSPVVAGELITAAKFNAIWNDLTQAGGHDHDGEGGAIDHASLGETGAISGLYHTHSNIETHMNGSEEAFDDSPGYDRGVHGHNSAVYVGGSSPRQFVILGGKKSSPGSSGTIYFSENGASPGFAFDEVVSVTLTVQHTASIESHAIVNAIGGSKDSFTYIVNGTVPTSLYFLAIGTKVK